MKEIIEKLKRDIVGFEDKAEFADVGIVTEVGDGIAKISGLKNALSQEILSVEAASGVLQVVAFNLEESSIGAVILGEAGRVAVGYRVRKSGKVLSLKAGDELLGRIIDPLGEPLDGKGVIFSAKGGSAGGGKDYPLERKAPSVLERESVSAPVHTGIKSIDAMIPIGRGQRELIIGDRQTGKTAIALDAILNQKQDAEGSGRKQVICIYVAVGQKNSKMALVVDLLRRNKALDYTVVVNAPAADSVDALRQVGRDWLGLPGHGALPDRWVFCNPSMCPEAWLIAALYRDAEPEIMAAIECNPNLENWLSQRPKSEGDRFVSSGKKHASVYQEVSPRITAAWVG